MSQITSEEVNYLIYRYLQEAGFVHSSFTFGQESFIIRSDIKPGDVPPGMLVTLLQRGLQYMSVEHHLNEDGSEKECRKPWSLLTPHVCEVPTSSSNQKSSSGMARKAASVATISIEEAMALGPTSGNGAAKKRKKENSAKNNPSKPSSSSGQSSKKKTSTPMFVDTEVLTLTGHASEVISCAWSPTGSLLASVAGDDTGRIWCLPEGSPLDPEQIIGHELILDHGQGLNKEVTTLDWRPDGAFLATGCYDGRARVWASNGTLHAALGGFSGPLFALRWSPSGRLLAGAGVEHPAVLWDALENAETPLRAWTNHKSPTLDLDWRDDTRFATCTTERTIYVYSLESDEPLATFTGHTDEINSVRWSPDGMRLASCSDDHTARIWTPEDPEQQPVILEGHEKEIYCLKWAPTGPGSANPDKPAVLATASFDQTVRIWNPLTGACLQVLRRHSDSVYAIAFSPDGDFLASGSLDESICVWSVAEGTLLRAWEGGRGSIFELAWSPAGERLAACTSESTVCVFDVHPLKP